MKPLASTTIGPLFACVNAQLIVVAVVVQILIDGIEIVSGEYVPVAAENRYLVMAVEPAVAAYTLPAASTARYAAGVAEMLVTVEPVTLLMPCVPLTYALPAPSRTIVVLPVVAAPRTEVAGVPAVSNTSAEPVEMAFKEMFCAVVAEFAVVATETGSARCASTVGAYVMGAVQSTDPSLEVLVVQVAVPTVKSLPPGAVIATVEPATGAWTVSEELSVQCCPRW